MKSIFKTIAASLLISATLFAALPVSHAAKDDAIDKAIKARLSEMRLRSFYAGPLFAMAKGKMDYDAAVAADMANNLKTLLSLKNGSAWLPGSDNEARSGDTRALPAIWAEGSEIGAKGKAYKEAVMALADVAGNGLDAMKGAIGALGDGCGGCHDDYRAKDY